MSHTPIATCIVRACGVSMPRHDGHGILKLNPPEELNYHIHNHIVSARFPKVIQLTYQGQDVSFLTNRRSGSLKPYYVNLFMI